MFPTFPRYGAILLPLLALGGGHTPPAAPSPKLPFQVGERLTFNVEVSALNAGQATVSVEGIEPVRGIPTFHTIFDIRGRVCKKFGIRYESWFDTTNLVSLRHIEKPLM